jgi:hypothetical protein
MIYVMAFIQVVILISFVIALSMVIDKKGTTEARIITAQLQSEERLEKVMRRQADELRQLFEAMSEKAFIEREQLLNRIQAPEHAITAAPPVAKGDVSVEDDEEEQPLPLPGEEPIVGDRIPMDDLLVRPKQPVGAMEPFLAEEDEEDGVS